jgi:hypothetical protein
VVVVTTPVQVEPEPLVKVTMVDLALEQAYPTGQAAAAAVLGQSVATVTHQLAPEATAATVWQTPSLAQALPMAAVVLVLATLLGGLAAQVVVATVAQHQLLRFPEQTD